MQAEEFMGRALTGRPLRRQGGIWALGSIAATIGGVILVAIAVGAAPLAVPGLALGAMMLVFGLVSGGAAVTALAVSAGQGDSQMVNYVLSDEGLTVVTGPDTLGVNILGQTSGKFTWDMIQNVATTPKSDQVAILYYPGMPAGIRPGMAQRAWEKRVSKPHLLHLNADLRSPAGARFGDRLFAVVAEQRARGALATGPKPGTSSLAQAVKG